MAAAGSGGGGISRSSSRGLALLLLASAGLLAGLLLDYMPAIIDSQIKRQLELATNEQIRRLWSHPPVDIHSYYWLYDIQNADQFLNEGAKVRVRKVGPFRFSSRLEKRVLEISQNKFRLQYNSTRHFRLDEQSVDLDERLTVINPIYASLVEATRRMASKQPEGQQQQMMIISAQKLAEKFNESLVMRLTGREVLCGRHVELLGKARKLADTFGAGAMDRPLPDPPPGNMFGLVAVQNGTWTGPYEIYTGYQASQNSLGDLLSFKGQRRLREFQGRCNRLQASAGELRPMPINENQTLEIFVPQMCRILRLRPVGAPRRLREGVTIGYSFAHEDFASAQENPDNRCFCQNYSLNDYCSLSGAIELAPCAFWAPIVMSLDHLKLDERITATIEDWDPELVNSRLEASQLAVGAQQEDTRRFGQFQILKRVGVPVRVDLTVIIFMKVIRDERFRQTRTVPEVSYVPLAMSRELAMIPPELGQIIVNVERFLGLANHLKVVMYLSSVVLLCWLTGHYYRLAARDRVQPSSDKSLSEAPNQAAIAAIQQQPPRGSLRSPRSSVRSQAGDSVVAAADQLSNGPPAPPPPSQPPALHFSQVDELRAAASRRRSSPSVVLAREAPKAEANEEPRRPPAESGPTGGGEGGAKEEEAGEEAEAGDGANDEAPAASEQKKEAPSMRGKNWFVKVYGSFVRLLGDIRSSLKDAGQLDISASDYQDKQLELLAGRIDTWQRQSDAGASTLAAADNPELGEANGAGTGSGATGATTEAPAAAAGGARAAPAEAAEQPVRRLMVSQATSTDDSLLATSSSSPPPPPPMSLESRQQQQPPIDERSPPAEGGNKSTTAPNGVFGDNDAHDSGGSALEASEASEQRQRAALGASASERGQLRELDSRKGINDSEPAILLSEPQEEGGEGEGSLEELVERAVVARQSKSEAAGEPLPAKEADGNISGQPGANLANEEPADGGGPQANKRRQIKGAGDPINAAAPQQQQPAATNANGNHISHHGKIILQRQANGASGEQAG